MKVTPTALDGVVELQPDRFADDRGWFSEVWNSATLEKHDLAVDWVQDNASMSAPVGTVRGLHYQLPPRPQVKLVRVAVGAIFDVAVDLRRTSPTFGSWVGVRLDAAAGNQLLIPEGFAHGFCTLEPDTQVSYKVSALWDPASDRSVRWDDESLGIDWPVVHAQAVLSKKDADAPSLAQADVFD